METSNEAVCSDSMGEVHNEKSFWNIWGLNPSVNKFLKKNHDVTLVGLFWAGYWRTGVVCFAVYLSILAITALTTGLIYLSNL